MTQICVPFLPLQAAAELTLPSYLVTEVSEAISISGRQFGIPPALYCAMEIIVQNDSVMFYAENDLIQAFPSVRAMLHFLDGHLHRYLALKSVHHTVIHGGAVVFREQAILLPGPSRYGKSTLTSALCKCGCLYATDELTILDNQGRLYPFPRPIQLREPDPTQCELTIAPWRKEGYPVAAILDCPYVGDEESSVALVPESVGFRALFNNLISESCNLESAVRRCVAATQTARVWSGVRGDSLQFSQFILDQIEACCPK